MDPRQDLKERAKKFSLGCYFGMKGLQYITLLGLLTVNVQHEGVLEGLERHEGVERLAAQRAPVVANAGPILKQRQFSFLKIHSLCVSI